MSARAEHPPPTWSGPDTSDARLLCRRLRRHAGKRRQTGASTSSTAAMMRSTRMHHAAAIPRPVAVAQWNGRKHVWSAAFALPRCNAELGWLPGRGSNHINSALFTRMPVPGSTTRLPHGGKLGVVALSPPCYAAASQLARCVCSFLPLAVRHRRAL
mgnify:CR=1 FL=1